VDRQEARDHHPAGAVRRVQLRLLEFRATIVRQQGEHRLAAFLVEPFEELDHVVEFQPRDDLRQALVAQGLEDLGQQLRRQLLQGAGGPVLLEQQVEDGADLRMRPSRRWARAVIPPASSRRRIRVVS
jgi:hypothetical protein